MYYDILDKEVEQKLDEYEKTFPDSFPLAQFYGSKKELIEEINKPESTFNSEKHKIVTAQFKNDAGIIGATIS